MFTQLILSRSMYIDLCIKCAPWYVHDYALYLCDRGFTTTMKFLDYTYDKDFEPHKKRDFAIVSDRNIYSASIA